MLFRSVFLELNYKTNTPFVVGMIGQFQTGGTELVRTLIINANNEWNKIYINLTATANYTVNVQSFKVFFEANKLDSIAEPKVFIDNIKLLYSN